MMSKGGERRYYLYILYFTNFSGFPTPIQRGRYTRQGELFCLQTVYKIGVCHHQKGGDCEEDFLLKLGWVSMMTKLADQKEENPPIAQVKDSTKTFIMHGHIFVSMVRIFDILQAVII